jgi:tetratricopeptide (TPR) repeat protein
MVVAAYDPNGPPGDLFSMTVIEEFERLDDDAYGYRVAQVFEPGVLQEVALLQCLDYNELAALRGPTSARVDALRYRFRSRAELTVPQLVNTATAMISISRFDPAELLIVQARAAETTPRDRFEVAMLEFVVANRRDDGRGSAAAFARMRAAIEAATLPTDRVLDACAQAVVWFLKRRELDEADFRWFHDTGRAYVKGPQEVPTAALSSWFRAIAMLPATQGDKVSTRQLMRQAGDAALQSIAGDDRPFSRHLLKTFYESSLKEHMYVGRDLRAADEVGRKLIGLDPVWGPSYAELAEAHEHFGDLTTAARLYEKAVEFGPPYQGLHRLAAATCRERMGDPEAALDHLLALVDLAPSQTVLERATALADRIAHPDRARLAGLLLSTVKPTRPTLMPTP